MMPPTTPTTPTTPQPRDPLASSPARVVAILAAILVCTVTGGCGDDGPAPPGAPAIVVHEERGEIGAAGGIVQVTDPASPLAGVVVEVPSGALIGPVELGIGSPSVPLPFERDTTVTVVQLEPAGLVFAAPVTVRLPWPGGAGATSDLGAFAWEAPSRLWRPLVTLGTDAGRRSLITAIHATAPLVVAGPRIELDAELVVDCGRIAAAIELTTPLADVPTSPGTCCFEGACDLRTLLEQRATGLAARIEARLLDASAPGGALLATRVFETGVVTADAGRHAVEVRDETGERLLLSPLVDLEGVERHLSGAPVVCVFPEVTPENDRPYAIEARLHHLTRFGGSPDVDGWCAHGLVRSTLDRPTTFAAMRVAPDVDCDGVVDAFDSEATPACNVYPTELLFPPVPSGAAWDLRFWVENTGDGSLEVDIVSPSAAFELVAGAGAWTVTAGEVHEVVVRFSPVSAGEARCLVETGSGFCPDVVCVGSRRDPPPGRIDDLRVAMVTATSVGLDWTAPGEDAFEGQASRYDLRYASFAITEASWYYATPVDGLPAPSPAWTPESFTVAGLAPGTRYWLALRAADAASHWSELSPVVQVMTPMTVGDDPQDPRRLHPRF